MGVEELSSLQAFRSAVADNMLVLVDAYADWCGPCKAIAPKLELFSNQYANIKFFKVNVDKVPDVAQELGVSSMPSFYLFQGGEYVDKVVGANPGLLETSIKRHAETGAQG
ncbi:thioredoxin-1 [Aspergillus udagawae]|uniref:Thioredoxin-1 n=1 Tax=Aspergillus udagawae TaxID=91492 RepID=A0A8H3NLK3_9EURO|nr:thioredoxin-1 [Aspergillus udagawae]GFG02407.1 thioredoxin-1 [Aspergillus udagawae]GFG24747.1 thioredoxin-1 [Aspergillus udagawae]